MMEPTTGKSRIFPRDCWGKKCEHFHVRDMSIDDLRCTCDLLKMQCDACDEDYIALLCPKQSTPPEEPHAEPHS